VSDVVVVILPDNTTRTIAYTPFNSNVTVEVSLVINETTGGAGTGDVVGPASAVNNRIATYNGTTGKIIKDGGKTIAEVLNTDNHTDGTTNKVYSATDKTKLAGIESGAEVNDTASEILTKLLTVDGNGSSLDADLLGGVASANYATKAYADALVVGLIDDRGNYDASGNTFPASGGSGTAGAVLKGDLWTVSVAGTLGGNAVTAGDLVRALVDTPGQTSANWAVTENNIGYVAENQSNKENSTIDTSTTKYPTVNLLKTGLDAKAPIASPTFTGTVTTPAIVLSSETASKVAIIDASKNVKSADTTTYPSLTELAYVKGVTSAIQTQIDSKLAATDGAITVTSPSTTSAGYLGIPQNSKSANYTTVMSDSGKHILHPAADTNARTFTIDSNANVAYPIGTTLTFINETANVVTIAVTSDTLVLAGTGSTGSRSLAQYGMATAVKITSTKWYINGNGLT
jgi:hypothetical protein